MFNLCCSDILHQRLVDNLLVQLFDKTKKNRTMFILDQPGLSCPCHILDSRNVEFLGEGKASAKSSKDANSHFTAPANSIDIHATFSSNTCEQELAAKNMTKDGPRKETPADMMEKEAPSLHEQKYLQPWSKIESIKRGWINDRNGHECNSLASAHAGKELLKDGISESAPPSNPLLIDFRKTPFVREEYELFGCASHLQFINSLSGTSSHGSKPLSAEQLNRYSSLNFDQESNGSRSASFSGSSSPTHLTFEQDNVALHTTVDRFPAVSSFKQGNLVQANSWEPSVPYRSSPCSTTPSSISTLRSHYDPFPDSVNPLTVENTNFQISQRVAVHNVSSQHINGNPAIGVCSPGYIAQSLWNFSLEAMHDGISSKDASAHGQGSTSSWKSSSIRTEEKCMTLDVTDGANINAAKFGSNQISDIDKGRNQMEMKSIKIFHAALVDYLKELIKPSWKEAHLSKDTHKMVLKKSVGKVLGTLKPHQVLSTTEVIDQYLSTSHSKLLKLVEGYVKKYSKSHD
ncbi:hypothetical protein J5N97_027345 [Dioscorea zingiberensis]|uniref:Uncharacterized protein n=1 Tax=Dioscorea zingiberensis TaxID=325984 RepID=A0A9D5C516_9LILI|nr:hypothetical protein J5N97_027345 [Dioscorea zingiberensis]